MAQSTRKRTSGKKTGSSSRSGANRRKSSSGTGKRTGSGRQTASGTKRKSYGTGKSASRSGSARRAAAVEKARRQNQQREREIRTDIALVLLLIVVVIIYISLAGFGSGVGKALSMILFGIFGIGAWLVPIWLLVLCFCLITQRGGSRLPVQLAAGALLILVIQSFGHLLLHTSGKISLDVPFSAKAAFDLCGENGFGGGIIGGWFARIFYRAFGFVGSVLVYIGLTVIALILLVQRSPATALRSWRERREEEGIPGFAERREMRRRRRMEEREQEEEERLARDAERILRREDRAAARAQQRQEREQNPQTGRKRRRSAASGSLDLEHTLLDNGTGGRQTAKASAADSSAGGRRRTGRIDTMDRRRDVHEIHVLTDTEREPMTAAPVAGRAEPGGTTYRRSSGAVTTAAAGDRKGGTVSEKDRESFDADMDMIFGRDAAGNHEEAVPVSAEMENPPSGTHKISVIGGSDRGPGHSDQAKTIAETPALISPAADPGIVIAASAGTKNLHAVVPGPVDTAQDSRAAGAENGPEAEESGDASRLSGAKAQETAAEPKAAASVAAKEQGAGFTDPTEEDLEGISVHRDSRTGNAAGRGAKTAASRKGTNYVPPTFSLLERGISTRSDETERELKETAYRLQETLRTFGVQVTITDISQGPSVTRYELKPDKGVKVSKIVNLSDDIKLRLAASDIRIEAPIPGKSAIGIEVPNKKETTLQIRELLESKEFRGFDGKIPFAVGKDIVGKNVITDIARMPHLLIAGATGSGKSVCINTIILSILYKSSPEKVRLLLIDPKVVELSVYQKIPHLIIPVVTDVRKASAALNWAVAEMQKRYNLFAAAGVRDLDGYNALAKSYLNEDGEQERETLPRIVIIVDELADLMMVAKNEVENAICRLAQLARAAGIHLIIATQRPSVDVITGLIKANMPSRIAFSVSSQVDSRTILDMAGAEKLIGRGDMLFYPQSYQKPARIQGAFVSDEEVSTVVEYIKKHNGSEMHDEDIDRQIEDIAVNGISDLSPGEVKADPSRDEHFVEAGRFIIEKNKASIGLLQRVFKIGFNRAARIMDQLAEAGVVSEESSTRARQVLMTMPEFEAFLENET